MGSFNNLKLSTKLLAGFAVTIGVACIVGVAGLRGIYDVNRSAEDLYANETVPIGQIGHIAKDFQRVRANLGFLIIATEQKEIEHDHQVVLDLTKDMDTLGESFGRTVSSDEMKPVFAQFLHARGVFLPLQERILTLAVSGKKEEAKTLFFIGDARNAAHEIESTIDKLVELKRRSAEVGIESNKATTASSTITVVVLLIVGVTLAVALGLFIARSVKRNLAELVTNAEAIAQGDLTGNVVRRSGDEVGQLAGVFGSMVTNLRGTVTSLAGVASAVASASSEISAAPSRWPPGRRNRRARRVKSPSAVEEMTKTIVENSRNATETAGIAKKAREAAEQGGKVVEETVTAMKRSRKS